MADRRSREAVDPAPQGTSTREPTLATTVVRNSSPRPERTSMTALKNREAVALGYLRSGDEQMEVLLAGIGSKTLADMAAKGWITRRTDKWGRHWCQITAAGQEIGKAVKDATQSRWRGRCAPSRTGRYGALCAP